MSTTKMKPRLQANNVDLTEILGSINNLPPAGTEDISAELDAQTEAINSLLAMVNRKVAENNGAGEWVWKKCWKYTVNLTQTTTGTNPTKFKVAGSGNNTDFTDVGFIVGQKFVSNQGHTLEFLDETHMRHTAQNGTTVNEYTYTWDAANATVEMPAQWSTTHTFTAQEMLRTKEFIVSAGEFDYPDREYGDDGYWYAQYYEDYDKPENIRQYIDIFGAIGEMSEGVSGIDFGTVTVSSYTAANITISHSLGTTPSHVLLISNSLRSTTYLITSRTYMQFDSYGWYQHNNGMWYAYTNNAPSKTSSAVTFKPEISAGYGFIEGTYYWFVW